MSRVHILKMKIQRLPPSAGHTGDAVIILPDTLFKLALLIGVSVLIKVFPPASFSMHIYLFSCFPALMHLKRPPNDFIVVANAVSTALSGPAYGLY